MVESFDGTNPACCGILGIEGNRNYVHSSVKGGIEPRRMRLWPWDITEYRSW
jgi:hypothetical protein